MQADGSTSLFVLAGEYATLFVDEFDDADDAVFDVDWHAEQCRGFVSGHQVHFSVESFVLIGIGNIQSFARRRHIACDT